MSNLCKLFLLKLMALSSLLVSSPLADVTMDNAIEKKRN